MAENQTLKNYAVIETGGRQHLVHEGDVLNVELLDAKDGEKIQIDRVLALSDGTALKVGTPVIEGAKVACTVVKRFRDEKVVSFKKLRRHGYHRKVGHRQNLMVLKVDKI